METNENTHKKLININQKKCVIIPAYNEAKNIGRVIDGVRQYCDADIVVIDDGSTDLTVAEAKRSGALVIRHPFNMGYGVALQTGYKYALENDYDLVLQMDGDGQHDPASICQMFEQMQSLACDVLIGSRFLNTAQEYRVDMSKTIGIGLFRFVIKVIDRKSITDPTSGYQCLRKKVFQLFTKDDFPCDYPDANIIIMLHRMGFTVREIPVRMSPNSEGRSLHKGLLTKVYYLFRVFLSIFITLIRDWQGHKKG